MKIKAFASVAALALAGTIAAGSAQARDQIQIVGSSTVFPFATAVAEQFGQKKQASRHRLSNPLALVAASSFSVTASAQTPLTSPMRPAV